MEHSVEIVTVSGAGDDASNAVLPTFFFPGAHLSSLSPTVTIACHFTHLFVGGQIASCVCERGRWCGIGGRGLVCFPMFLQVIQNRADLLRIGKATMYGTTRIDNQQLPTIHCYNPDLPHLNRFFPFLFHSHCHVFLLFSF